MDSQESKTMNVEKKKKNIFQLAAKSRRILTETWNNLMEVPEYETTESLKENLMGLLRVHVKRGKNLAIRDFLTSDPYVVFKMGHQRLKTRVVDNDLNPEWNDNLTLCITDPSIPIKLEVYDYDMFSMDDEMGDAEFEIMPYVEAIKMKSSLEEIQSETVISILQPSTDNCLSKDSAIYFNDEGKILQDLCLRLRNVECGEVELQLEWIHFDGCKMF